MNVKRINNLILAVMLAALAFILCACGNDNPYKIKDTEVSSLLGKTVEVIEKNTAVTATGSENQFRLEEPMTAFDVKGRVTVYAADEKLAACFNGLDEGSIYIVNWQSGNIGYDEGVVPIYNCLKAAFGEPKNESSRVKGARFDYFNAEWRSEKDIQLIMSGQRPGEEDVWTVTLIWTDKRYDLSGESMPESTDEILPEE